MWKLALAGVAAVQIAQASTVAIIDSGTDYKHKNYVNKVWVNPNDSTADSTDNDGNGYVDDIYGWNFAEKNNQTIDYKYVGTFSQDAYKFFEIQGKMFEGTATQADKDWMASKRGDEEFIKELSKFGNFIHGTHVGGIATQNSEGNLLLGVKLIPTEVGMGLLNTLPASLKAQMQNKEVQNPIVNFLLGQLAKQQMKLLTEVGTYVNSVNADVANGSFGTGPMQAEAIVKAIYGLIGQEPTQEQVDSGAKHFLETVTAESANMVSAAPNTLFVFAAGNDANDNDILPTSPASVVANNSITVAATHRRDTLATFSSFGATKVHVAAPGVIINSAIPGDEMMAISGTSQAAPYVSSVAGKIVDANTDLTPAQIKEILMGTVDKKDFLRGKVVSGGIVNPERAVAAAKLAHTMSVSQAIATSKASINDIVANTKSLSLSPQAGADLNVLPLPSMFKIQ